MMCRVPSHRLLSMPPESQVSYTTSVTARIYAHRQDESAAAGRKDFGGSCDIVVTLRPFSRRDDPQISRNTTLTCSGRVRRQDSKVPWRNDGSAPAVYAAGVVRADSRTARQGHDGQAERTDTFAMTPGRPCPLCAHTCPPNCCMSVSDCGVFSQLDAFLYP